MLQLDLTTSSIKIRYHPSPCGPKLLLLFYQSSSLTAVIEGLIKESIIDILIRWTAWYKHSEANMSKGLVWYYRWFEDCEAHQIIAKWIVKNRKNAIRIPFSSNYYSTVSRWSSYYATSFDMYLNDANGLYIAVLIRITNLYYFCSLRSTTSSLHDSLSKCWKTSCWF